MSEPRFLCPICGAELHRSDAAAICCYCGAEDPLTLAEEPLPWRCPQGHHLCEPCRLASATVAVERSIGHLSGTDPYVMANLLMSHPSIRIVAYGPDHHGIAPAALLSSLRNMGLWGGDDDRIKASAQRAAHMLSGSCYLTGTCGAVVGAGAAISTALGLDIRDPRRGIALATVAKANGMLAETGGVRCCKEAVYTSIGAALDTLAGLYPEAPSLRHGKVSCAFSSSMPECKGEACPYHPRSTAKQSR